MASVVSISCKNEKKQAGTNRLDSAQNVAQYDLADIENAGELIAVTISGPQTYYQFHGRELGLQYALAENFANSMGLRLRMEVARDTSELYHLLLTSKVDLIAYPLPAKISEKMGLKVCGVHDASDENSWSVRKQSVDLSDALNEWFHPALISQVKNNQKHILTTPFVRRHARAVFLNRGKGVISSYDALFIRYSAFVGWDWRLLAAQSYQESAFDPQAVSWAGAKGLLQIMPSTASTMGISSNVLFQPEANISTAVRYLNKLQHQFDDIRNPLERQKFVLASYNGGYNHIRDAQRLAQKYHRNPQSWDAVSFYVYNLSNPHYYRDPVVRYGYMIGGETYNYVNSILDRYAEYRGVARPMSPHLCDLHSEPEKAYRKNRFTRHNSNILSREDSIFKISH
jgi:membrane-bound lytic murein transglycosylase F